LLFVRPDERAGTPNLSRTTTELEAFVRSERAYIGRPSPAMVVACIALIVALSGTGYAAIRLPANSVRSKQIKNGQVKKGDLGKNSVDSSKVRDNSLTGADVNESSLTLGKLPAAVNADHATSADNATNASKLGGVAASSYKVLNGTLQSGQTEQGVFAGGGGTGDYLNIQIEFDPDLPADLDSSHTVLVPSGTSSATHCPGVGQADPGYFCLYEKSKGSSSFLNFGNPIDATTGADRNGENVFYTTSGDNAWVYGGWAVTAP
jgi:hypothetical protein